MWYENGTSVCVCVCAGKLRKALPHSGTPWPLADLQPLPHAGAGWAEGRFTAGLSGEEEEPVTIASLRHRCRHDSLTFAVVPSAAPFLRPPLVFQARTLTDPRV